MKKFLLATLLSIVLILSIWSSVEVEMKCYQPYFGVDIKVCYAIYEK